MNSGQYSAALIMEFLCLISFPIMIKVHETEDIQASRSIYIYICMYVCMYTYIHTRTYICTDACMHTYQGVISQKPGFSESSRDPD